jgi:phosphoribosylanthranilate isomerase
MSELQPDGIDCSSGVETAPGEKDLNKVKELLNIVKEFKDNDYNC